MATTHVFIVNEATFPIHLRFLFAGTSAGRNDESMDLLADIACVRPGDPVIFYIEGTPQRSGGFLWPFFYSRAESSSFSLLGRRSLKTRAPNQTYLQNLDRTEAGVLSRRTGVGSLG